MGNWKNANRMACISGISTMLATWAANVAINSKCNRNDLAVISEHTICGLLNRMYGYNLRNANTPKYPNFPGVDLVDEIAGVAVQVTVDNSLKKVDHTLEKFWEYKLNRTFSKLILMIITLDNPTEAMKKREEGCFYGKRDIWNIPYLIREIENTKSIDKLREIAAYLDGELGNLSQPGSGDSSDNNVEDTTKPAGGEENQNAEDNQPNTDESEQPPGDDSDAGKPGENADSELPGGEPDAKEPKESFLKGIAGKLESWKRNLRAKKEQKKGKDKKTAPGKKLWLLVPVILAAALLVFFLLPEKELEAMPPELTDYSMTINGETLSLPTTFDTLEELGWLLEDAALGDQWVEPDQYCPAANLTNGFGRMVVSYSNPTAHTLRVRECVIWGILCDGSLDLSYTGESVNTLECPLGLILKQSRFTDIEWPKGYRKNNYGALVVYEYALDHQAYQFCFANGNKELTSFEMKNKDPEAMAALMGPVYDTQPPEYDPESLAGKIGVEIYAQIGQYRLLLGCPISRYEELGYTQDKAPEYVGSGRWEDMYFSCDTRNQVQLKLYNPFRRALASEHCFVGQLDSLYMKTDQEQIDFVCIMQDKTLNLHTDMSVLTLMSQLALLEIEYIAESNGDIIIYPETGSEDIRIRCAISDGLVSRIQADMCDVLRYHLFELYEKFQGVG